METCHNQLPVEPSNASTLSFKVAMMECCRRTGISRVRGSKGRDCSGRIRRHISSPDSRSIDRICPGCWIHTRDRSETAPELPRDDFQIGSDAESSGSPLRNFGSTSVPEFTARGDAGEGTGIDSYPGSSIQPRRSNWRQVCRSPRSSAASANWLANRAGNTSFGRSIRVEVRRWS